MNRQDAQKTAEYLSRYIAVTKEKYDQTKRESAKRQIGRDLAAMIATYRKVAAVADKTVKVVESDAIEVGVCACGTPIKIGEKYTVGVHAPTTIKRVCQGKVGMWRRCGRINQVVLNTAITVELANWHVRDCICGQALYARGDYGGGVTFGLRPGFGHEGDLKNRTIRVECPSCGCKWIFEIRFTEKDHSAHRSVGQSVIRCKACPLTDEFARPAEKEAREA